MRDSTQNSSQLLTCVARRTVRSGIEQGQACHYYQVSHLISSTTVHVIACQSWHTGHQNTAYQADPEGPDTTHFACYQSVSRLQLLAHQCKQQWATAISKILLFQYYDQKVHLRCWLVFEPKFPHVMESGCCRRQLPVMQNKGATGKSEQS
jgi:hypothetical protein